MQSQSIRKNLGLPWPFKRRGSTIILFYAVVLVGAFVATRYVNVPSFVGAGVGLFRRATSVAEPAPKNPLIFPLKCVSPNETQTCPVDYPATFEPIDSRARTCPEYFKWIHDDLRPWKARGITRDMVEAAKPLAFFRIVVLDGKVYWKKYRDAYQTRDVFTIWGMMQVLRLYPGQLPDLDIMFEAGDVPVIKKSKYKGFHEMSAPPMFHFCGDDKTLDIVFPDWSFWGWPEININGWEGLKKELKEGNKRVEWMNREPFAFWRGNPYMGDRMRLLKCNSTHKWNAQIVTQDWYRETKMGFKTSNLAQQCIHRYKIYIEGIAWSVSEKYILACDSMTLLVTPQFYEFFTRSLQPMKHFWPINPNNLCKSIKFAVHWGNRSPVKAQKIGKAGSKFVQQELTMNNVYDYMFHLLNEYGKLLRYKPTIPENAIEICLESMACLAEERQKGFMLNDMIMGPSMSNPCTLQPPQDSEVIKEYLDKQESVRQMVDKWVAQGI